MILIVKHVKTLMARKQHHKKIFTPQEIANLEKRYAAFLVKSPTGNGATVWKCTHDSCNNARKRVKNEWASIEAFHIHVGKHPKGKLSDLY